MLIVCQKIGLKFKKPDLLEFSHHKNEEFMKFDEYENDLVDVMSDETETKVLSICLYLCFLKVQRFCLAPCSFNGSWNGNTAAQIQELMTVFCQYQWVETFTLT